jgi:hypothetical protein
MCDRHPLAICSLVDSRFSRPTSGPKGVHQRLVGNVALGAVRSRDDARFPLSLNALSRSMFECLTCGAPFGWTGERGSFRELEVRASLRKEQPSGATFSGDGNVYGNRAPRRSRESQLRPRSGILHREPSPAENGAWHSSGGALRVRTVSDVFPSNDHSHLVPPLNAHHAICSRPEDVPLR